MGMPQMEKKGRPWVRSHEHYRINYVASIPAGSTIAMIPQYEPLCLGKAVSPRNQGTSLGVWLWVH